MNAKKVTAIPRRPIKIAFHVPLTVLEHEALFALGRVPVRVQFYEGGPVQETAAKAQGRMTDAQLTGDRIVVTVEWIGADPPPDDAMRIIGFHEEPMKRPAAQYRGMGTKVALP